MSIGCWLDWFVWCADCRDVHPFPAVAPVSSGAIRPVPGDTRGVAGAGTTAAKAPPPGVPPATPTTTRSMP